jgi:hypothetical protein
MSRRTEDEDRADPPATLEQVRQAQDEACRILAGIPEVSGFGIERGPGGFVLKVNLTAPSDGVPGTIGGVPVRTEVVAPAKKR